MENVHVNTKGSDGRLNVNTTKPREICEEKNATRRQWALDFRGFFQFCYTENNKIELNRVSEMQ